MSNEDSKVRVVIEGDSSSLVGEAGKGKQSVQDLGAGTEQAAEKVKLFSGEGREMHRIIGELTRISPLLGEAFRIALLVARAAQAARNISDALSGHHELMQFVISLGMSVEELKRDQEILRQQQAALANHTLSH